MKITALAGGIGAAKLLLGLQSAIDPEDLSIIANTGDDILLYGLRICPDVDTVIYTLAGVINQHTGWGIGGDTFETLSWLARYGERTWFNLGDRDLAAHIFRTELLNRGASLSEVTDKMRQSLGVRSKIIPMTDEYSPTKVVSDEGEMHLQEYFVRRRCEPRVRQICLEKAEASRPAHGTKDAIANANAVIVCPSNPFISIGPILAVPGIRDALRQTPARVVAVTPIVNGRALKGPTADMLRDLGHDQSPIAVAKMYQDFANAFVLDQRDSSMRGEIEKLGMRVLVADTVMDTLEKKRALANSIVDFVRAEVQ